MARTPLQLGEVGQIRTYKLKGNLVEARARVGTLDGVKQLRARADRAQEARDRLMVKARKAAYLGGHAPLDGNTTLKQLVEVYLDAREEDGKLRPQSVREYRHVVKLLDGERGDTKIGQVPLSECGGGIVKTWIEAVAQRAPSSGKRAKQILTGAFEYALGEQPALLELWHANPAERARVTLPKANAATELTGLDLAGIRAAVDAWQTPRRSIPLKWIIEMTIATGARPNEVLALRWSDMNLSGDQPTVEINGTLVYDADNRLVRQDTPKTDTGNRVLGLPHWAVVEMLELRGLSSDLRVFPSRAGTWMGAANVRRAFREALKGTDWEGWKLKDFRSGVATRLARALGSEAAARQLGHASPVITQRHYIRDAEFAGDFTAVLEAMAPGQSGA